MGEAVALIDLGDHFDPRVAEANGVDLRRLLWIRPKTIKKR
jgi:RecA/RadA recombinase